MQALNKYEQLAAINVNAQVEKKGGLSYLSWAWAVDHLLRIDPDAEWRYDEPVYLADRTALVFCSVKCLGKWRGPMQLPVMDHRNKAIKEPDAFAINTAMQRCLVKAIALHGLGLYIYAGEDLPPGETPDEKTDEPEDQPAGKDPTRPNTARQAAVDEFDDMSIADQKYLQDLAVAVKDMVEGGDDAYGYIEAQKLSIEHKMALWSLLSSQVRSALKKAQAIAMQKAAASPKAPLLRSVPELASQG